MQTNYQPDSRTLHQGVRFQTISIRDELERLAWMQNPELAQRLDRRQASRSAVKHRDKPRRILRAIRWQDRVLISLSAILLSLFVVRVGTAEATTQVQAAAVQAVPLQAVQVQAAQVRAAEQMWGMQLQSAQSDYTQMAFSTDVQIDITGLIARVEVTQIFRNQSDEWSEGVYRFPLPQGAAVDRLRIKVGERILEGEIQEKETARRVYQQARASGRTATLVEQQRRNQFENRVANIGPGESIEVTIGYLQNISYSNFSYHLNIPMTFTPRWTPPAEKALPLDAKASWLVPAAEPVLAPAFAVTDHTLSLQARLLTSSEFAAIESRYHDVDIRQIKGGYEVSMSNPYALADRDFELSWTPALQTTPGTSLSTYNDGDAVYAQLMLAPPVADVIDVQPREVILIIDTSGSMQGASMTQAKAALRQALHSLRQDDYFNLLEFNSVTTQLFNQSLPVTGQNRRDALYFINSLQADGGTEMQPALEAALSMPGIPERLRQVIFITDGAVGNEQHLLKTVADQLAGSRMFTVAIGSAPNSWFMRKAAEIGRGSFVHIGDLAEVEEQMSALWGRIQTPALTDICVDWGEFADFYPEIIPDLYAGEPLWLIAKLPAAPSSIHLCGQFNNRLWELDVNGFDATEVAPGNDNLAILWARNRIEALEDALMFGADRELTRLEITNTALQYGLLTQHTSLVAVDKTPRRSAALPPVQRQIPGLLPAGSSAQLAGFPSTATGWVAKLSLSLFALLLSSALLWFSGSRLPMVKVRS